MVNVTDEQVATLRAQLVGQADDHRRLLEQLDPATGRSGYPALVAAAFALAVDRRFADANDTGIMPSLRSVGYARLLTETSNSVNVFPIRVG